MNKPYLVFSTSARRVLAHNRSMTPTRINAAGNEVPGGAWAYLDPRDPVVAAAITNGVLVVTEDKFADRVEAQTVAPEAKPKRRAPKKKTAE